MRLGGRLQAAIDILQEFERHKRPVSELLKEWGHAHRFAGSSDRTAIATILYAALRHYPSLSWRMESVEASDIIYATLLQEMGFSLEELTQKLAEDRFAPSMLSQQRQQSWQSRILADASDSIQAELPQWSIASFERFLRQDWVDEGRALAMRPSLDLRINPLKPAASGEIQTRILKALDAFHVVSVPWFEQTLRIAPPTGFDHHPPVQREPLFQKGWFEIQDMGSQIAAYLCSVTEKMQVLDYCAGAGGKSLALAGAMKNRGQIYAYDSNKQRLAPIFERLRRSMVRNIQVCAEEKTLASLLGRMDRVVVDAPCTGSGVWRRHPDSKWRLTPQQLEKRVQEQKIILAKAAHYVKPSGKLIYITCSLFYEENDGQIDQFLQSHPQFQPANMPHYWDHTMPLGAPVPYFSQYGIVLSPLRTGTDGFFIAILEKDKKSTC